MTCHSDHDLFTYFSANVYVAANVEFHVFPKDSWKRNCMYVFVAFLFTPMCLSQSSFLKKTLLGGSCPTEIYNFARDSAIQYISFTRWVGAKLADKVCISWPRIASRSVHMPGITTLNFRCWNLYWRDENPLDLNVFWRFFKERETAQGSVNEVQSCQRDSCFLITICPGRSRNSVVEQSS